jgi:hypothetical protein
MTYRRQILCQKITDNISADTKSEKNDIVSADLMSKKLPTLCQLTLIHGATKYTALQSLVLKSSSLKSRSVLASEFLAERKWFENTKHASKTKYLFYKKIESKRSKKVSFWMCKR